MHICICMYGVCVCFVRVRVSAVRVCDLGIVKCGGTHTDSREKRRREEEKRVWITCNLAVQDLPLLLLRLGLFTFSNQTPATAAWALCVQLWLEGVVVSRRSDLWADALIPIVIVIPTLSCTDFLLLVFSFVSVCIVLMCVCVFVCT